MFLCVWVCIQRDGGDGDGEIFALLINLNMICEYVTLKMTDQGCTDLIYISTDSTSCSLRMLMPNHTLYTVPHSVKLYF